MAFRKAGLESSERDLGPLSTDPTGELDVLGHDGHSLGMDGAQVGIFKESNQVGLASFLQGSHSGALEAKVSLEVLGDFTNQSLEGQFSDQQLCGLLVATDLTESDCARLVAMGLLHSPGGGCTLTSGFGGELFAGGLASSGLASGLLRTSHHFFGCLSLREELPS